MTRLFIAEKPSLGKAIAERLKGPHKKGNGYIETSEGTVTWCFGHMFEQPGTAYYVLGRKPKAKEYVKWEADKLPIVPKDWKLFPKSNCTAQLKVIQGLLKKATSVVNAGDPDREGQLLIDELLEYYKFKGKEERIWLNAIDNTSVDRALNDLKPNSDYKNLKDEALGRSRADWLLGMNLTQAYTIANKARDLISIGRVQTPSLALIAKRDNEIDNFKPVAFFTPFIDVDHENGKFRAIYKPSSTTKVDSSGRIIDKQVAVDLINKVKNGSAFISAKKVEDKQVSAPLPFSLSSIQKEASFKFGFGAKETLDIIQKLYDGKIVSYPRSDCDFLPTSQYTDSKTILNNMSSLFPHFVKGADSSVKGRAFNDSKVSAHHAIVPTMVKANMSRLSPKEKSMYELICRNYAAQFYPSYKYQQTSLAVDVQGESFVARGKVEKDKGWRAVIPFFSKKKDGESDTLPDVNTKDKVTIENASALNKKTTPPSRFTEGTLIDAMKNIYRFVDDQKSSDILKKSKGIGTEATRAGIIETLLTRGFVGKKGKSIVSTDSGKLLVSQLQDELKNPVTTAAWEMRLEFVGSGKLSLDKFVDDVVNSAVIPLCDDMKNKTLDIQLKSKGANSNPRKTNYKSNATKNKTYGSNSKTTTTPYKRR